jgi:predicted esterase
VTVHAGQPLLTRGPAPEQAGLTAVVVHGRGGSAADILSLADAIAMPGVSYVAPQAAGRTWYPKSFLAPLDENEPHLSSALATLAQLVGELDGRGIPAHRIALMGFSQGACLSLEFAARHPRRYAAIAGLSGGLIGPPGTPRRYPGSLDGTPVFLGCSDIDAHIPLERVRETAAVFRTLGAIVDERIYPGMGHTINEDEVAAVRALMASFRTTP